MGQPLDIAKSRSVYGLDAWAVVSSSALVLFICIQVGHLATQASLMALARQEICGGNLNFTSGIDELGKAIVAPHHVVKPDSCCNATYAQRAIRQMIMLGDAEPFWMGRLLPNGSEYAASPAIDIHMLAFFSDEMDGGLY